MKQTIQFSNEKNNEELLQATTKVLNSLDVMGVTLDDLYPINVGAMVGSVDEIRKKAGTFIRSLDFPNTIWIYGNKQNNPLQLQIVVEE